MWRDARRAATALLLLFAACSHAANPAGSNPRGLPNPTLVDQHGRQVRFYDDLIAGRKVVLQFMYTHCEGVCPVSTANLVEAQREVADRLGKDLFLVSISLDPKDTAQDLAEYASTRGMADGWTLVAGAAADIEALRKALGAYDLDPEVDAVRSNHSAMLVLGDDRKDRWTMVNGISPASAIVRAIQRLLEV